MFTAKIKVNGKDFELSALTEIGIKQQAISLINFKNGNEQNKFLKELSIESDKPKAEVKKIDNIKPEKTLTETK